VRQAQVLRAQLRPHFLFNALNAISGLLVRDPARARATLLDLDEMYHASFRARATDLIPLSAELERAQRYARIEQVRFGSATVEWMIAPGLELWPVPPLTLQPLVENATVHAGRSSEAVTILVRALLREDVLTIHVEDDGPGLPHDWNWSQAGVGLQNIRDRMKRIYQRDDLLDLRQREGFGTRATIAFPKPSPSGAEGIQQLMPAFLGRT
jgi:LytS/YehU family sensor histidine kinase